MLLWIISCFILSTHQISGPNCLRSNPEILHADFNFFNTYAHSQYSKYKIVKHVSLFSTRFQHGHEFGAINHDLIESIGEGVSHYVKSSKKRIEIFLTTETVDLALGRECNYDVEAAIGVYKEAYNAVNKVNSESKGPVVGLYLHRLLNIHARQLEAVNSVFGPNKNSTILIRYNPEDCFKTFKETNDHDPFLLKYLQRMDFLSCSLPTPRKPTPEGSAEAIIENCDRIRDMANSVTITGKIRCLVSYPSYGTTSNGIQGSVSNFQRFWCKVVDILKQETPHAQIIMESAFDATPDHKSTRAFSDLQKAEYHFGWWKRRHINSYEGSAFLEKVEELEGGTEHGNCTAECGVCGSDEECCGGKSCDTDYSFQPFENVRLQTVCQSSTTKCAPRLPKSGGTSILVPGSLANLPPQEQLAINGSSTEISASSDTKSEGSIVTVFIITVAFLSAILLAVIIGAFVLSRGRNAGTVLDREELENFFQGISPSPSENEQGHEVCGQLPYDTNLEVKQESFVLDESNILGSGAFGLVVRGRVRNEDVAVKTTLPGVSTACLKALIMELKVLMYLGKDDNIVNLLGAHTSQLNSGKLYLFLELCPLGNLLQFLRGHRDDFSDTPSEIPDSQLTCRNLFKWSIQISSAMSHLVEKRVIHADIAARNILVFSRDQVKLTDFGLSRRLYEYNNYVKNNQEPVPWRHMSIESLRDFTFSFSSDVWSFGVTLWEMFSLGNVPYPGNSLSQNFLQLLLDGLRLECPQFAHPLVYEVMSSCWKEDSQSRPKIACIHSNLACALDTLYTDQLYVSISDIA